VDIRVFLGLFELSVIKTTHRPTHVVLLRLLLFHEPWNVDVTCFARFYRGWRSDMGRFEIYELRNKSLNSINRFYLATTHLFAHVTRALDAADAAHEARIQELLDDIEACDRE
jgi:hypothetical protein